MIELEPFSNLFYLYHMKEQQTVLYDVYDASQQWYNKQICKSVSKVPFLIQIIDFLIGLAEN